MPITIIIEDGTGPPGANSFLSLDDARARADDMGRGTLWNIGSSADETDKKSMVDAYRSMEAMFDGKSPTSGIRFTGMRQTASQTGTWPRKDAYYPSHCESIAIGTVPDVVLDLFVELASISKEKGGLEYSGRLGEHNLKKKDIYKAIGREFFSPGGNASVQTPLTAAASSLAKRVGIELGTSDRIAF